MRRLLPVLVLCLAGCATVEPPVAGPRLVKELEAISERNAAGIEELHARRSHPVNALINDLYNLALYQSREIEALHAELARQDAIIRAYNAQ